MEKAQLSSVELYYGFANINEATVFGREANINSNDGKVTSDPLYKVLLSHSWMRRRLTPPKRPPRGAVSNSTFCWLHLHGPSFPFRFSCTPFPFLESPIHVFVGVTNITVRSKKKIFIALPYKVWEYRLNTSR